jgi:GWxTD domain-containing protein
MRIIRCLAIIAPLAAVAANAAEDAKVVAVLDFPAFGTATAESGVDVADNVRLMFHGAEGYELEKYERTHRATEAALKAGLDLTAVKDVARLGKALGDDRVVTGRVTFDGDLYTVQVWVYDVDKKALEGSADAQSRDLRQLTEDLIKGMSGAEQFGVLFPDEVRDLPRPTEEETRLALAFIATDEELALFDILSPRGRSMMLEKFWVRRDPDPSTPENEYEAEFWRRVDYVQKHFTDPIRGGLRTDRGKVYILYGPPDDIEDHAGGVASIAGQETSTWSTKPYYAWKYYSGGPGGRRMLFVFVDDVGDGDYSIFASTEPGFGRHIASFAEFDINRLVVDEEDWGDTTETTFWDSPGRFEGK